MSKIFITGSADGLGQLAAKSLVGQGHEVVLHARHKARGEQALGLVPGAASVLTGDLSSMEETKALAAKVNALGPFDAIIHNAGVYRGSSDLIFVVNTIAPYLLTCLIQKPTRLIYLSSGLHTGGDASLKSFGPDHTSYSDSKLHNVILAKAVARKWPEVYANAVNPGWVPTKMGGAGAPDDLKKGHETQAWLAISDDAQAKVSGFYFFHQQQKDCHPKANRMEVQEQFLASCAEFSGVNFPEE